MIKYKTNHKQKHKRKYQFRTDGTVHNKSLKKNVLRFSERKKVVEKRFAGTFCPELTSVVRSSASMSHFA